MTASTSSTSTSTTSEISIALEANDINKLGEIYKSQFTEHQIFVMNIAIEQLGSSFNIVKSNGFKKWLQKQQQPVVQPAPIIEPQAPIIEPPKKKKKVVVKKKKTPKSKQEIKKQSKLVSLIDNLLTEEWKEIRKQTENQPFIVSDEALKTTIVPTLSNNSSLYCFFTEEKMLYVGTTTDTKKNLPLAYKTAKKALVKETEKQQENQLIYALILPNDENKQRVRMRDIIKKALLF